MSQAPFQPGNTSLSALTDPTNPFNMLRSALKTEQGRAMIEAIVDELYTQSNNGYEQGSIRLAIESARRKAPSTSGMSGSYKVDNTIAPAIARWLIQTDPDTYQGWLEVRRMDGELADVAAAYNQEGGELPIDNRLYWLDVEDPYNPKSPAPTAS